MGMWRLPATTHKIEAFPLKPHVSYHNVLKLHTYVACNMNEARTIMICKVEPVRQRSNIGMARIVRNILFLIITPMLMNHFKPCVVLIKLNVLTQI